MAATASPEPGLDLKSAVNKALKHCMMLFNDIGNANFMLEEVEYNEGEGAWLITIGFDVQRKVLSPMMALMHGENATTRTYKSVKVDGKTGKLLSVKIRKLD